MENNYGLTWSFRRVVMLIAIVIVFQAMLL